MEEKEILQQFEQILKEFALNKKKLEEHWGKSKSLRNDFAELICDYEMIGSVPDGWVSSMDGGVKC